MAGSSTTTRVDMRQQEWLRLTQPQSNPFFSESPDTFSPLRPRLSRRARNPAKLPRWQLEMLLEAIFAQSFPVASSNDATAFVLVLDGGLLDLAATINADLADFEDDDPAEENGDREPYLGRFEWPGRLIDSLYSGDDDREEDETSVEG